MPGRIGGVYREPRFQAVGRPYNRVRADATAFPHRQARLLLKHAVVIPAETPGENQREARDWLTKSWAAGTVSS